MLDWLQSFAYAGQHFAIASCLAGQPSQPSSRPERRGPGAGVPAPNEFRPPASYAAGIQPPSVPSSRKVAGQRNVDLPLQEPHPKTLAVETEAGGVAQAFYEQVTAESSVRGWLAIRGISDSADEAKDDTFHAVASTNAAAVLERLIPYLTLVR